MEPCGYFTMDTVCVLLLAWLCVVSEAQIEDQRQCWEATIYGLKTANCDHKNLNKLPDDLDRNTQVLKFNENHLSYLPMDYFKSYKALQEIYLVRNRIEIMAPDAFRGLHNLQRLELEGNKLSEVPTKVFQHLRSVRILNLKSNQIKYITNEAFKDLPNIEDLNFENCWLERIDPLAFKGLTKLYEVNLVNNELTSLSAEMAVNLPLSLNIFRLYRNPWVCDCKLRWLREWLTNNKVNWDFGSNTPACDAPELIRTIKWPQLSSEQFACATHIIANSSTSIQLQVGGNVTIECIVFGDPEPKISWMKDSNGLSKVNVREQSFINDEGEKQIRSSLHLEEVTKEDAADYKCIADNPAGRSEKTYKVWVEYVALKGTTTFVTKEGIGQGAMIGIGVGALIIVLLLIILVVCVFKKSGSTNRPYVVREYKKANHNAVKDKNLYKVDIPEESATITAKEPVSPTVNVAHTELLLAKEVNNESEELETEKENGKPQNHISNSNEPKSTEFKMKIFTTYDNDDKGRSNVVRSPSRSLEDPSRAAGSGQDSNHIREATPDLLCDDKHSRTNHKTPTPPPPPAAYYVNHIASVQKRAEENPYAKPSELKSGGQKTPDTSETLLDYTKALEKAGTANNIQEPTSPKSVILSPRSTHKEHTSKDGRHKADSPCTNVPKTDSTCTNPVCMKAHSRSKSHVEPPMSPRSHGSHASKPHISSSHSVGSMSDLDCSDSSDKKSTTSRGSKGEGGSGRHQQAHPEDRYKTLPCRGSQGGRGSPARKLPQTPVQSANSSSQSPTGPPVMYSERGTAPSKPRVQFASPVRDSPSSSLSSTPTSPRLPPHGGSGSSRHLPIGSSATMGRPSGNPIHPKGLKVMSPEGPRTLTFPGAIETLTAPPPPAPPGSSKPTRTYGCSTSIDDLLSPPFAHLNTDPNRAATATIKRGVTLQQPGNKLSPGHKDEYGTAV